MILRLHSVLTGCLTLLLAALLAFAPVGARPASGHQADRAGGHLIPAVASRAVPGTRALQGLDTPGRTFLVTETMGVLQLGIGELGAGQPFLGGATLTVGAYGGRLVLREGKRIVSVMSDEFKALNKVVGETADGFAIVRRDNGSLGVLKADGSIVATNRALPSYSTRQLQHEYKHAPDFGVTGDWNTANGEAFRRAIDQHIADPATTVIQGTYRGQMVTHHFNASTENNVFVRPDGSFWGGGSLAQIRSATLLRMEGCDDLRGSRRG